MSLNWNTVLRLRLRLQGRLWGEPGASPGGGVLWGLRVLFLGIRAFKHNHLEFFASGLSFYLLLSMVPFLAFVLMVLDWLGISRKELPHLLGLVAGGSPVLARHIADYADKARTGLVGWVGVVLSLMVGYLLLQRVKAALNTIWEVEQWAGYRERVGEYLTVLIFLPLALGVVVGSTGLLSGGPVRAYLKELGLLAPAQFVVVDITGYVLLWVAVYFAYANLPDKPVNLKISGIGAMVTTAGLVMAENMYLSFLVGVSRQNLVYGALALLPSLMAWFYMAWMIFLLGAQFIQTVQNYTAQLELRRVALAESKDWWAQNS
ncbi:MAG: YihY/virulence factor BrkB family protein [Deltaproteobacteria bacterium]|nr:YihY/virulence factor BrkB family protein [Deltaproteobacteria bacterium]